MKPILCHKISYWKDPAFKKRLGFPPAHVPAIHISLPTTNGAGRPAKKKKADAPVEAGGITFTEREITADDMPKLDKLSLTDYSADFDSVEIPKGKPITDDEMHQAFGSFLASMAD